MNEIWAVVIGTSIGIIVITIYGLLKNYLSECKQDNESQKLAMSSMILSFSGIILFGITSLIGIILGIVALKRLNKHKALAIIGIALGFITISFWLFVIIFGP